MHTHIYIYTYIPIYIYTYIYIYLFIYIYIYIYYSVIYTITLITHLCLAAAFRRMVSGSSFTTLRPSEGFKFRVQGLGFDVRS